MANCESNAFNFTEDQLWINLAVSVPLQTVASLCCLFVVTFIVCTKLYQLFSYRLILYLMATDALYSLTAMIADVPVTYTQGKGVHVRDGWQGACAGIAYISQMIESAKLTVIVWMVTYLLLLATLKFQADKLRHELLGALVTLLVPLVKDWFPFVWKMYGLSGLWCWIRLVDDDCRNRYTLGFVLMFVVEYGPVLIISVYTVVSFIIILVRLRKDAAKAELSWRGVSDTSTLKAGLPLIAFPLMYMLIFWFKIAHRIYYMVEIEADKRPFAALWLVHTIAVGVSAIIIPMVYVCYPSTLKRLCAWCLSNRDQKLASVYRRESLSVSKDHMGSSGESDPFLPKGQEPRDSLLYKSILSSVATSVN